MASAGSPQPIGPVSNQYGTGSEIAWQQNHVGSAKVVIGVVDTGVQADHPDLAANIDVQHAKDFVRDPSDPNYNRDENGHGTHVAGIIGAVANNGIGIAGVAWKVSIIPVKMVGSDGNGGTDTATAAFNYLVGLKQQVINIVAINASWATTENDPLLLASIKKAARAGIAIVSAADNQNLGNYILDSLSGCAE